MKNKLILFDFDGVIVDSFEQSFETNKKVCPSVQTKDQYRAWFHGNLYDSIKQSTNNDDGEKEKAKKQYWNIYVRLVSGMKLFAGVKEVLEKLKQSYNLALVSSQRIDVITQILEQENIQDLFAKSYDSEIHESKIEKFKMACHDFNVSPSDCLFVTDTLGDLKEAEKAGVDSIAVSWGYHDIATLERGKYTAIVHKPEELLKEIHTT